MCVFHPENMDDTAVEEGVRLDAAALTVARFRRFLRDNRPVLVTGATSDWSATRDWVHEDGSIDVRALSAAYGHCTVPVVDCRGGDYGEQPRQEVRLSEYLERWSRGDEAGSYMKDWHFVRDCLPGAAAYSTPAPFADDWLNWWWTERRGSEDDYRFVYLGPAGTSTPLHHDVLLSYSWSANVAGCKRWTLFPPSETHKLLDRTGRRLAHDVHLARAEAAGEFPALGGARRVEVVQRAGEALFVPAGWHHQVVLTASSWRCICSVAPQPTLVVERPLHARV